MQKIHTKSGLYGFVCQELGCQKYLHSCISKRLKNEMVLLHSELCWEGKNFCSEIPENLDSQEKSVLDVNGRIHGPAKNFGRVVEDGTISWLAVQGLMLGKIDGYKILGYN